MKSVLLHGVLAALGLFAAYHTFTRGVTEQVQPGEVTVVECEAGTLQRLVLNTKNRTVSVEPKRADGETFYWIDIIHSANKNQDKNRKTAADDPLLKGLDFSFVANSDFDATLRAMTPLKALRELGKTSEAQRKAFELDKSDTEIALTCAGRTHVLQVGASTYGEGDRYARKPDSDRVYLLKGSIVSDLNGAQSNFMQRPLHGFELEKVEAVKVKAAGASTRLLQRDRGLENAMWVDAAKPEQRNKLYGNWLSQLSRLGAIAYLALGKEPGSNLDRPAGEVEPVVYVEYEADNKPIGKMDLVRVRAGDQSYYYAKSEKTRGWVTVTRSFAEQVAQDVALVVGADGAQPAKKPNTGSQPPFTKTSP